MNHEPIAAGDVFFAWNLCLENPLVPRKTVQDLAACLTAPCLLPVPGVQHWDSWAVLALLNGGQDALIVPALWEDLGHEKLWRRIVKLDYKGEGCLRLPFLLDDHWSGKVWLLLGFSHIVPVAALRCRSETRKLEADTLDRARAEYRKRFFGK